MFVSERKSPTSLIARLAITIAVGVACVMLMKYTASFGLSRILGRFSVGANSLAAANEAVTLAPSDPEAHQARSILLNQIGQTAEAVQEMELAVTLRPQD